MACCQIAYFRTYMSHPYLKKSLGQHFLKDEDMLQKISNAIGDVSGFATLLEIGPGMGALTKYLVQKKHPNFYVVELDDRWAAYIRQTFSALKDKVIHQDFLQADLQDLFQYPTHVVGNFPYNISSQIVFKVIDYRDKVTDLTGMFQKEMAMRIAAKPGSKDYGVISVLTQAYFDCTYLFDIPPACFDPPPKVMSGIIHIKRKESQNLGCDEKLFKQLVKQAFNQRRKTLRNSLSGLLKKESMVDEYFTQRPERLSVQDFVMLTNKVENERKG